jgi:N utilization substance protein A
MPISFDTEKIRLINLFENLTGAPIRDCIIENNTVYFIVESGKIALAIGKNGSSIKHAEKVMKKNIKVFEFSDDCKKFAKNLIPQAIDVKLIKNDKKILEIHVEKRNRALVIGRDGRTLNIFKKLLQRNHDIDDVVVK